MCVHTCVAVYMHVEIRKQPQIWILTFYLVCGRVSCFVSEYTKQVFPWDPVFPVILPLESWDDR